MEHEEQLSEKRCGNCINYQEWEESREPGDGWCDDGKGVVNKEQRCCGHWKGDYLWTL